nr:immunoglobulin heavy chain junction region [Macaca mulatta]MOX39702.1 immunoglobulin heavy chain junction region [Macaca mulatta]MOX40382.1 immunoglobulin heavy chain junction region [Macaca mulatta]MOX40499.1 immunoglobulin heavy chain junction region [Macaca mulatta]
CARWEDNSGSYYFDYW